MTRNTVVAFSDDQGVTWPCLSCADRGLQLALSKDASLPKSALEEWLSSEAFVDDELDLEQFAAVIRTSVSTARDYCAHGLVPGAYKRQRRKWSSHARRCHGS